MVAARKQDLAVSLVVIINTLSGRDVNGKLWQGHVLVLMRLADLVLQSSCGLVPDTFLFFL